MKKKSVLFLITIFLFSFLSLNFISADSVAGDIGSPQTLNRYIYVTNNPLKYVDPSGGETSCFY